MEDSLTDVKGIGPVTADKLKEAGISTLTQLAITRPDEISAILGISLAKAKELTVFAKDKALDKAIEIETGQQVLEHRKEHVKYISTGSVEFDRILGGGFPTDSISMLTGAAAVGKTQTAFSLAISCISKLHRPVAFIETEPSTFTPERLLQIAELRGVKIDLQKDVYVVRAKSITNPYQQMLAYELMNKKLEAGIDFGLLIVDSFSAKFRQTYLGREMLTGRTQELARHLGYLEMLTSKYNIATVLTAQIMGIPDTGAQLGARLRFKMDKVPYGGEFMLHAVGNLITLQLRETGIWTATVVDSAYLESGIAAQFKITAAGIEDVSPQQAKKATK